MNNEKQHVSGDNKASTFGKSGTVDVPVIGLKCNFERDGLAGTPLLKKVYG
jgi:hypothetical protein